MSDLIQILFTLFVSASSVSALVLAMCLWMVATLGVLVLADVLIGCSRF